MEIYILCMLWQFTLLYILHVVMKSSNYSRVSTSFHILYMQLFPFMWSFSSLHWQRWDMTRYCTCTWNVTSYLPIYSSVHIFLCGTTHFIKFKISPLREGGTILYFRGKDQRKYETDLKFSRFIMNLEIYKSERPDQNIHMKISFGKIRFQK